MKYWEIIADNLSKAGLSWGCVSIRGWREETGSGNKGKSIRTLGGIWKGGRQSTKRRDSLLDLKPTDNLWWIL